MIRTLFVLIDLLGIALMSYGAWLHYQPLGFAVGGVFLWLEANSDVLKGIGAERATGDDRGR